MAKTLLIFCLAAAGLAAKDRAWQTGNLLDTSRNPFFKTTAMDGGQKSQPYAQMDGGGGVAVNVHTTDNTVAYDQFVVDGGDKVYMVELTRLKVSKAPRVSLVRPVTFAVDKEKLWILDADRAEYETRILKQVDKAGFGIASAAQAAPVAQPAPPVAKPEKVAQAKLEQTKVEQAKVEQAKVEQTKVEQTRVEKPKPQSTKPDNVFATASLSKDDVNAPKAKPLPEQAKPVPAQTLAPEQVKVAAPPPAQVAPAAQTKQDRPAQTVAAVVPPKQNQVAPTVISKSDVKPAVAPATPESKPPAAARPEAPIARASSKDRPWQSGQLLSVPSNNYFFNVTYTSDLDGATWAFSQGSDGRYTVTGKIADETRSAYTFDNYVIESQFVAYLVQRMRPKTSPPARFPGMHALKFAVDKGKLWVLDDEGKEYETKVIKLVQKDAIVDPLARASAK